MSDSEKKIEELLPRQVVEELDKYIVGQEEAKRAVAVALRNRYRREQLPEDLRNEIVPKNILMIGPTGVGKTEIARRLAKMTNSPFIKVEATKYTEVGYVGRDVESMIRDLAEASVRLVAAEFKENVRAKAEALAIERLLDALKPRNAKNKNVENPFSMLFPGMPKANNSDDEEENISQQVEEEERQRLKERLLAGEFDERMIDIEVEDTGSQGVQVATAAGVEELGVNFNEILGDILPKRTKKRKVTITEALEVFRSEESEKLIDIENVKREAIRRAEERGIIFIDELDKIVGAEKGSGPDVSREGVQRDILPIVEGSTVTTKYGPVRTDHILFVAAGAFHTSKPSDLVPELQGRFPIRVTLKSLGEDDFRRILVEPKNALTRQYTALLAVEGLELSFTEDGIEEMANTAHIINAETENIGARRLHTILERVLEKVSFGAAEIEDKKVVVDREYVKRELSEVTESRDLSRFIL